MTLAAVPPETLEEVLAHLRREYAGVLDEAQLRTHVENYIGLDIARDQVATVARACRSQARVLDVGCGYGAFVLAAREHGLDAVGIDLAGFELRFARERLARVRPGDSANAVYKEGSALDLPFGDGSLDAITMWNVLEHVLDPERALREAARVLGSGGRLFAVAPNYASFRREAHYQLPWLPLLPRRAASAYLRALGRDPTFFEREVHYVTNRGVMRTLASLGFSVHDPRADKIGTPFAVRTGHARQALELVDRLRLERPPRALLAAAQRNPLRTSIGRQALTSPSSSPAILAPTAGASSLATPAASPQLPPRASSAPRRAAASAASTSSGRAGSAIQPPSSPTRVAAAPGGVIARMGRRAPA
jgi:SAM-dependent methyltransferase